MMRTALRLWAVSVASILKSLGWGGAGLLTPEVASSSVDSFKEAETFHGSGAALNVSSAPAPPELVADLIPERLADT